MPVYERGALPFLPGVILSHWPGASLAQRPIPFADWPGDNFPRVVSVFLTLWSTGEEGTSHEPIREPSRRKR